MKTRYIALATLSLVAAPATAQVVGVILDSPSERQAQRDARRAPYASPGYGNITTATGAREACAAKALGQAGPEAIIIGTPRASTMSTDWEVYGDVGYRTGSGGTSFVCSVRNGSISGVLLRDR